MAAKSGEDPLTTTLFVAHPCPIFARINGSRKSMYGSNVWSERTGLSVGTPINGRARGSTRQRGFAAGKVIARRVGRVLIQKDGRKI